MLQPKVPPSESSRLQALQDYAVLDTPPESAFDSLTRLATLLCDTPIALISLVDSDRQWIKSKIGPLADQAPRDLAFCAHAINHPHDLLIVPDARLDERFAHNPLVTGPAAMRFYAGAPLVHNNGTAIGTLCVFDHKPRELTEAQRASLQLLARQVITELELRRQCNQLLLLGAELQSANRELENFSHCAAHDLKEPLRKMHAFSRLIREDLGENIPPDTGTSLSNIESAAVRMRNLIDSLLLLSQIRLDKIELKHVQPQQCVAEALEALSKAIERTGATITVDDLPRIRADRTMLTQVFYNLISNGLKFDRGQAPAIQITCTTIDGVPVFGVRDNGIGIEPAYFARIFEPFKRLHARGEFEGTGIGLAIVHKAIERHGGRIWVESTPGQGSHFRFTIGSPTAATTPAHPV